MKKRIKIGLSSLIGLSLIAMAVDARAVSRKLSPRSLAELKGKGMVFSEISPDEMAKMKDKVKPVVEKYVKDIGDDLMSQARAEIEKVK